MSMHIHRLLFYAIVSSILGVSACGDKQTGDLTRELVKEVLAPHLIGSVREMEFDDGGLERATANGLVVRNQGFSPSYRFTELGLPVSGAKQNLIMLFPMGAAPPTYRLSSNLNQEISMVTGMADGPTPNIKIVEYTTAYTLPKEMKSLAPYLILEKKLKTRFQKYDDGWRVAE